MDIMDLQAKFIAAARPLPPDTYRQDEPKQKTLVTLFLELYSLRYEEIEKTIPWNSEDPGVRARVKRICEALQTAEEVKSFISFVFLHYYELREALHASELSVSFISTESVLAKILYYKSSCKIPTARTPKSTGKYKDVTHRHDDEYQSDSIDKFKAASNGNSQNTLGSKAFKYKR